MEQISRRDGKVYYGARPCVDIEEAYGLFRDDYHRSLGRNVHMRLDRIGYRRERFHGYGFVFSGDNSFGDEFAGCGKIRYRMGLVLLCYCRILGIWDCPELPEESFDRWFDWAFTKGRGVLRLVGLEEKAGRTSKRLKSRYK